MSREFIYENFKRTIQKKSTEDILSRYHILATEANSVRERDKELLKNLFGNFYSKHLNVGVGFQRAYGAILSGDYFDLIAMPDGNYLFVFADISGHGLPAYTTLVRLRSAITLSLKEIQYIYNKSGYIDPEYVVKDVTRKFTDIMDNANSHDFACINFTFIYNYDDKFYLKFFNRSMLFPIVVRKFNSSIVNVYNLNTSDKGWIPVKGHLVGSDIRQLLDDRYYETPCCEFIIYEGDSILFFSDGITEAFSGERPDDEFGQKRLETILIENIHRGPQEIVDILFNAVFDFIGVPQKQKDDMTAVLIDLPLVR